MLDRVIRHVLRRRGRRRRSPRCRRARRRTGRRRRRRRGRRWRGSRLRLLAGKTNDPLVFHVDAEPAPAALATLFRDLVHEELPSVLVVVHGDRSDVATGADVACLGRVVPGGLQPVVDLVVGGVHGEDAGQLTGGLQSDVVGDLAGEDLVGPLLGSHRGELLEQGRADCAERLAVQHDLVGEGVSHHAGHFRLGADVGEHAVAFGGVERDVHRRAEQAHGSVLADFVGDIGEDDLLDSVTGDGLEVVLLGERDAVDRLGISDQIDDLSRRLVGVGVRYHGEGHAACQAGHCGNDTRPQEAGTAVEERDRTEYQPDGDDAEAEPVEPAEADRDRCETDGPHEERGPQVTQEQHSPDDSTEDGAEAEDEPNGGDHGCFLLSRGRGRLPRWLDRRQMPFKPPWSKGAYIATRDLFAIYTPPTRRKKHSLLAITDAGASDKSRLLKRSGARTSRVP